MSDFEFKLPEIGEGVMEGEIVDWHFEEGQKVEKDTSLVSVLTDKATVEIACPHEGTLARIIKHPGDTVSVGETLAFFGTISDGKTPSSSPEVPVSTQQKNVPLPEIGEGVIEGELVEWHVQEGDQVTKDQLLFSVLTDKATVEITSPYDGKVGRLLLEKGATVMVGQDVLQMTTSQKTGPVTDQSQKKQIIDDSPISVDVLENKSQKKALASPAVRKKARELGVDLDRITGSGPSNRITMEDLLKRDAMPPQSNLPPRTTPKALPLESKRVPIKGLRKAIFHNMAKAKHTIPHFTYVEEIEMDALMRVRGDLKDEAREQGVQLSYMPFIMKAVVLALKHFPIINTSVDEEKEEIIFHPEIHLGIATSTERGLMVPVVHQASQFHIFDLARKVSKQADKARSMKTSMDDVTGSTFTITSLGKLGGVVATPIINYPETGILGVYEIRERAVVRDGQIVIRQMMNLSGTFDHRIIDGDVGAAFVQKVKDYLEHPARLLTFCQQCRFKK